MKIQVKTNPKAKVKLSRVSKLDGIRSWSLEAGTTCPGSFDGRGNIVDACEGCYAKGGNYRFPRVNNVRQYNRKDWKRDDWVFDMMTELDNDRYFRWFDSVDIYHPELAKKILLVCKNTPWVKHWIPTRSYKVQSIYRILIKLSALSNVVVRYSSDSVEGGYEHIHGSTIIPSTTCDDRQLTICMSYKTGRCNGCRNCWNKSIKIIAYPAHGRRMIKLINDRAKG